MTTSKAKNVTPRSLGYSMPAEWAPHRATWLSWPHNRETWPTSLEKVREVWIQMICALAPDENVDLLVNDDATERNVSARLTKAGALMENIRLLKISTVDVWMRDYGLTFLTRNSNDQPLAGNDWIFNGWGGKYKSYEEDDQVARKIAPLLNIPVFEHDIILEGGSIEVNGAGTCLTTGQCLLNKNRNPHFESRPDRRASQRFVGRESFHLARRGNRRRRHRRPYRRHRAICRCNNGRLRARGGFQGRQLHSAPGELRALADCDGSERKTNLRRDSALSRTDILRRRASAGELREFLYCE